MKKCFYLFSIFVVFLGLNAQESYRPYPIIWVHGIWSNPGAWGVAKWSVSGDKTNPDSVEIDSLKEGSPIWEILQNYFLDSNSEPYYDKDRFSYTPEDPNFRHIYQEVVLFDPSDGTIDKYDLSFRSPNDIGRSAKLV